MLNDHHNYHTFFPLLYQVGAAELEPEDIATGVEFAGALMELIHGSLERDFPGLDLSQVRVLLLKAADHLLDGMPKELSD